MTEVRDDSLDGLRGVAALAVALSHVAAMTWTPFLDGGDPAPWQWGLWHLGAPAVDVFFVLSGYVVAASLLRRPRGWGEYALSRAVRLLPVAWIAIGAGLCVRISGLHPPLGASQTLSGLAAPLTAADVAGFMTLVAPMPNVRAVNPPLWTMMAEMQIALAMPLLAVAARRSPVLLAFGGIALCLATGVALNQTYPLMFPGFFVGAALAAGERRLPSPPRPALVLAACAAALLVRHVLATDDPFLRAPCAIAAAGLIVAVRAGAARPVLTSRVAAFLGRVSYPLYAVHWPIMAVGVMAFGSKVGIAAAAAATIPLSILAAAAIERLVDRHAVALSRILGRSA